MIWARGAALALLAGPVWAEDWPPHVAAMLSACEGEALGGGTWAETLEAGGWSPIADADPDAMAAALSVVLADPPEPGMTPADQIARQRRFIADPPEDVLSLRFWRTEGGAHLMRWTQLWTGGIVVHRCEFGAAPDLDPAEPWVETLFARIADEGSAGFPATGPEGVRQASVFLSETRRAPGFDWASAWVIVVPAALAAPGAVRVLYLTASDALPEAS